MAKKILISFSGGRTSAFMTQWLLKYYNAVWNGEKGWFDGREPDGSLVEIIVVFANTGKERQATLEYVQRCDEYFGLHLVWVEAIVSLEARKGVRARVVNFQTASRNGEPFEAAIQKFGLPNQNNSFCSRDLKGETIKAHLRSIGFTKFWTCLGIRSDERHRVNFETARKNRILYPLVTMVPTTKSDVALYWSKMPFDLELKSYEGNCDLCWKKSTRKLLTLIQENPGIETWWKEMERKYENHLGEARKNNPNVKLPMRFFRARVSVADLVAQSKTPFAPAEDESKDIDRWRQMTFFEMVEAFDPELDLQDDGCAESCEAFQFA